MNIQKLFDREDVTISYREIDEKCVEEIKNGLERGIVKNLKISQCNNFHRNFQSLFFGNLKKFIFRRNYSEIDNFDFLKSLFYSKTLKTLDLSYTYFNNANASWILKELIQTNESIVELNLNETKINIESFISSFTLNNKILKLSFESSLTESREKINEMIKRNNIFKVPVFLLSVRKFCEESYFHDLPLDIFKIIYSLSLQRCENECKN